VRVARIGTFRTLGEARRVAQRIANRTGRRVLLVPAAAMARARRRGNPWITLSNKRRVELDAEGRVVRGGPADWQGVHVRDLPAFSRAWRPLRTFDCEAAASSKGRRPRFRRKLDVYDALVFGNKNLFNFLDQPWQELQNLDTYEEFADRKFADWRAALLHAIPARGYWDEVFDSPRMVAFRAAAEGDASWPGGRIVPPEKALVAGGSREAVQACETDIDRQIQALRRTARGRLELEEAPF
jgi:hypothetical protein